MIRLVSNIFDMYVNQIKLLPRYFKLVGLVVILVCIVIRYSGIEMSLQNRSYTTSALFLGIVIIAFSRNKIEDELSNLLRLKVLVAAFLFGVFEVILSPVFEYQFNLSGLGGDSGKLIFKMLTMYFCFFYLLRRIQHNG